MPIACKYTSAFEISFRANHHFIMVHVLICLPKKDQIVALSEGGFPQCRIAADLRCSQTVVGDVIRRFGEMGPTRTDPALDDLLVGHQPHPYPEPVVFQWQSSGNPVCPELRPQCTLECHWRKNCW